MGELYRKVIQVSHTSKMHLIKLVERATKSLEGCGQALPVVNEPAEMRE